MQLPIHLPKAASDAILDNFGREDRRIDETLYYLNHPHIIAASTDQRGPGHSRSTGSRRVDPEIGRVRVGFGRLARTGRLLVMLAYCRIYPVLALGLLVGPPGFEPGTDGL